MASRSDTGEVLHVRLRNGKANSSRGVLRFAEELITRVARAGASGEKLFRADSAFWNKTLMKRLQNAGWLYSISIRVQKGVAEQITTIPESGWQTLSDYPKDGEAQIAETTYDGKRMIIRRTRMIGAQAELWPDWRHFPFLTNRTEELTIVEAEHVSTPSSNSRSATSKTKPWRTSPPARLPQQRLDRDRRHRAQPHPLDHRHRAARPDRPRCPHAAPPAAADPRPPDHTARKWTLHLPARWPGQHDFIRALARIRALPALA